MDPINQFVTDHVITPLQQAAYHLPVMDAIHHACVRDYAQSVGQLFGPGGPFEGKAAQALSHAVNDYLAVETRLTAGDLSQRLSDAISMCDTTAASIQREMEENYSLPWPDPSSDPTGLADLVGIVGGTTLEEGVGGILAELAAALAAIAAAVATAYIENKVQEVDMVLMALLNLSNAIEEEEGVQEPPLPEEVGKGGGGGGGPNTGRLVAILLVSILGAAGIVIANSTSSTVPPVDPQRKLSSLSQGEWADLYRYLSSKYGCTADEIKAIVNKLDRKRLTVAQLEIILQVLQVKAQMEELLNQMAGYDTPGINRLRALLQNDIKAIDSGMRSNIYNWTQEMANTWLKHLKSAGFEWETVQALGMKNITGFEVRHPGLNGQVDFETADGTWYESKMEGTIDVQSLLSQLEKYARAGAPSLGVIVPEDAPRNIGYLLLAALRRDGFTRYGSVKVIFEPPYTPPNPGGWCSIPDLNYGP